MNYIITKKCNKNCPYCFAHETRITDPNGFMPLETFKKIVLDYNDKNVKLLGGEPTLHPQFKEIIDFLVNRKYPFTVISNFLFNNETLNLLLDACSKVSVHFLINATDLDKNNRIERWSKNYNNIYRFLYNKDREMSMSIGLTFYQDNPVDYYINYLEFIKSNIIHIEKLRLSLNFPGEDCFKNPTEYIDNYDAGHKFLFCVKWALDNGISPHLDCQIYPCMFETKEEFKFVKKFLNGFKSICGINEFPCDIFPNEDISYCYPLQKYINDNLINYKKSEDIKIDFLKRYNNIKKKLDIPDRCTYCKFFVRKECNGPNICHYNLSNIRD